MSDDAGTPPKVTIKADDINASEALKLTVEVWKKTVDVQQHFNDIALRLRSIAITVLVGAVGAAFYVAKDAGYWASLGIVFMASCGWAAFFVMDRFWYHLFLRAAAMHGGEIEKANQNALPAMFLSNAISAASGAVEIPRWPPKYIQIFRGGKYSSTQRLVLFYQAGFGILAFAGFVLLVLAVVSLFVGRPTAASPSGSNPSISSGDVYVNPAQPPPSPEPAPVLSQPTAPRDEPTPRDTDPSSKQPDDPKARK